jgi:ribonuclease P protein subunit RPR2
MMTVAQERMERLLKLGKERLSEGDPTSATRYVRLARKIGMRYNVRMPKALRSSFCHSCSSYLSDGVNARVRLRGGRVSRTCLSCGAVTRSGYNKKRGGGPPVSIHPQGSEEAPVLNEGEGNAIEEEEEGGG